MFVRVCAITATVASAVEINSQRIGFGEVNKSTRGLFVLDVEQKIGRAHV